MTRDKIFRKAVRLGKTNQDEAYAHNQLIMLCARLAGDKDSALVKARRLYNKHKQAYHVKHATV